MTVFDLIAELQSMVETYGSEIEDLEVMARYDYGDINHTQALATLSEPMLVHPVNSAYSMTGRAVPNDPFEDGDGEKVVVI